MFDFIFKNLNIFGEYSSGQIWKIWLSSTIMIP